MKFNTLQKNVDKFLQIALRQANRVSAQLRVKIINDIRRSGTIGNYNTFFTTTLQDLLRQSMLLAHIATYKNYRQSLVKKSGIQLANVAEVLQPYANSIGANIDKLQERYNTNALRVLNGAADNIERELRKELVTLFDKGTNLNDSIKQLGKKFDNLGLGPKKDYQLEAIFRTQMQIAYAAGKQQAESDPDIASILWGYTYVTTGDDRVRDEHAILEGTTLPKDDPFWQRFSPPNGWNCRCTRIPVFEAEQQKRPDMDKVEKEIDPEFKVDFGQVFSGQLEQAPLEAVSVPETYFPPPREGLQGQIDNAQKELFDTFQKLERNREDGQSRREQVSKEIETIAINYHTEDREIRAEVHKLSESIGEIFTKQYSLEYGSPEWEVLEAEKKQLQENRLGLFSRAEANLKILEQKRIELNGLGDEVRKSYFRTLAADGNKPFTVKYDSRISDQILNPFIETHSKLYEIVSPEVHKGLTINLKKGDGSRAFASLEKSTVNMNKHDPARVHAHEIAHLLEHNANLVDTCKEFLRYRCAGEEDVRLNDIFPGRFDAWEKGKKDNFTEAVDAVFGKGRRDSLPYYIGKEYKDATEVLSVGTEMLWHDAAAFAKADPEFFSFVVGCLQGKIK